MADPQPASIPERLGPYEILGWLGQGGMGAVYRARDPRLDRTVAIKVLLDEAAGGSGRRERFLLEARAIAAFAHPNIVAIYSVEEDAGRIFLTMEYVDGRRLSDLIPKEGMALRDLMKVAVPLTDAIAAAHEKGIVHRDLKPSNVMVSGEGRVKVLDFGLAKLRDSSAAEASMTRAAAPPITAEGVVVGTVAYMAPEQAEGKPVDHRADIFSLGVMLYEMATGRRPFAGETSGALIAAILRDMPPPVTEINAALPAEFARIVRRCLAKDRTRRYQTAIDVRNDLEELGRELEPDGSAALRLGSAAPVSSSPATPALTPSAGTSVPPSATAPAPRAKRWLLPVAVAGIAAAALAGYYALRPSTGNVSAPSAAIPLAERQVTSNPAEDPVWYASMSPDGKFVVFGDYSGIHVRLIDTGETKTIPVPEGICFT